MHQFSRTSSLQSKHSSHETKERHRGSRDNNSRGSRVRSTSIRISSASWACNSSALGFSDIVLDVGRLGLAKVQALDDLGLLVAVELGAREVARGLRVEGTAHISELWELGPRGLLADGKWFEEWEDILSEVTGDVDSTSLLERSEAVNGLEGRAVGNQETTTDRLQQWHGDVCKVSISDVGDITSDLGQVWCHDALHVGSVNTESGVDGLEGWD